MVAEARTWVDVEAAVRAWLREYLPEVEGRVFFAFDGRLPAGKSQVVVQRIWGPDDRCLIQFDVWGRTKAVASQIASVLATEADALGRYTFEPEELAVDGDEESPRVPVLLHGALVESVRWQPDEESGKPRYVVEAMFTATAAQ